MLVITLFVSCFVAFVASQKSSSFVGLTFNKKNPSNPGKCIKAKHGQLKLVIDRLGEDRVVMCSKEEPNSLYIWKSLDGSSTLGEYFDPAVDCSDVVDRVPDATNGFYWIHPKEIKTVVKAWCDVTTDGGGYLLVAKKNDSVTWTVPSSKETVDPFGNPHWSSIFGNITMLDVRFQFSTTSEFKDTKAHWSFRLASERRFEELLIRNRGGCTEHNPGIGDIKFVKDLQIGKVVSTEFRCSLFGAHVSPLIGWGMMNKCLQRPCPGFAFFPGLRGVRFDDSGSFSYSAKENSTSSGIAHSSTAFIGCSHGKCCACYGPKGGTDNYCLKNCSAINGGKVITQVVTWIWIRSSLPKRVWRKCIDFTTTDKNGKKEMYRLDEETGLKEKGRCGTSEEIKKNGAVLVVPNKDILKKIPPVQGLLAFRRKNQQLLVQGQKGWNTIAMEKKVQNEQKFIFQELKAKQKAFANQLNGKQKALEQNQQNMERRLKNKQLTLEKQQQTSEQQLKNKQQALETKQQNQQNTVTQLQRKQQVLKKQHQTAEQKLNSKLQNLQLQLQALQKKMTKMHFMDSQILRGKTAYLKQLSQWVPFAISWSLCYRATRDGWSSYTFHSKCDNKGATVTIIRVGSYIFGGYSDVPWGGSSGYRESWNSFIFSFVNRGNRPPFKSNVYRNPQYAIYTNSGYGPTFGGHDIYIRNGAGSSTGSYTYPGNTYRLPNGYSYGKSNTKSFLAGNYNNFRLSELEVFYVN